MLMCNLTLKLYYLETSLVVQWLRFHASIAGGLGTIPGQGTRYHMLQQQQQQQPHVHSEDWRSHKRHGHTNTQQQQKPHVHSED